MNASLPRVLALLCCLLPFAAGTSFAVEVSGLFEAAVPVAGQGAGERARATAEGFRQVLVKASGQRAVLANPAVQQELGKAESLVGSYRYESIRHEGSQPALPGAAEPPASSPRLRLKFDQGSVLGVLNRGAAPVWSANRPQVYLWVQRDTPSPQLFALGMPQADTLLEVAGTRGLPVAIPAPGDLAAGPVAESVPAAVLGLASRIGAQVVLAASVSLQPGKARAQGMLVVEGNQQRLDILASSEEEALRELVEQVADVLGARYGVVARQDQVSTVRLRVDGVRTLAEWAALERWLASQPLVRDAVVSRVDATGTEYTLVLAGALDRLLQAMRADGRFAEIGEPVADGAVMRIVAAMAAANGQ